MLTCLKNRATKILTIIKNSMKKTLFLLLVLVSVSANPVYGHKLISHDGTNTSFDSALKIPNHKISWAIYEDLKADQSKFYSFEAKKGDSFYAGIVIPKIVGLEQYAPTIILVSPNMFNVDKQSPSNQANNQKFPYEGNYPGTEFYEPFGQVTYWERQEISTTIPEDGTYFIIVMDEKSQSGKYSLAVGTIEDFSGIDFFTILPKAWVDTKLFVGDFLSLGILVAILSTIPTILIVKKSIKKRVQKI